MEPRGSGDPRPVLSICIITGRRIPMLDACLASLQVQVDPPSFEVLVCSDGDDEVAAAVLARFPAARICHVDRALPGAGRNLLVEQATGELLLFLDDDVTVRSDMLRRLADIAAEHPEVGAFGGPNDSPDDSTRFQFVQGAVMASIVGAGPVRRRYGAHPAGPADERFFILCNLAIRREVMLPFDHELICAEENALLHELRRAGVPMHFDPSLVVMHERRPTMRGFGRQMHKYGRGRGQLMVRRPATIQAAFLAPSALVGYLVAAPVLAVTAGPVVALVPLLGYALAVAAGATAITATLRRPTVLPLAGLLIVELHLCYGFGVLRGLTERTRTGAPARGPLVGRRHPRAVSASGPDDGPSVTIQGLSEAYRTRNRLGFRRRGHEHWALRELDLEVPPSHVLGIIGSNGSGKTTLLQVVAGVLPPTRGQVKVRGRVGSLVDLSAGFHRDLTGRENLMIGGVLLGLSRDEIRTRLDDIVAFSGLSPEVLDWPLASYSAGMGLRLGFSLIAHTQPDVLLVDEVLAVGDDAFQRQCTDRVELLRETGTAVMLVSHDLELIVRTCNSVLVLAAGAPTFLGDPVAAVAHHLAAPAEPDSQVPASDRAMYESSWRTQAARRRRGV